MDTADYCTCPPEPPIDYGRGWTFSFDNDEPMRCTRCKGRMRPEQDAKEAKVWTDYMEKKANGGPTKLGGGW